MLAGQPCHGQQFEIPRRIREVITGIQAQLRRVCARTAHGVTDLEEAITHIGATEDRTCPAFVAVFAVHHFELVGCSSRQVLRSRSDVFCCIPLIGKVPVEEAVIAIGHIPCRRGDSASGVGRLQPELGCTVGIDPESVPPTGGHRQRSRHPLGIVVPQVVQVLQKAFAAGLLAPGDIGIERSLSRDVGVAQEVDERGIGGRSRHRRSALAGKELLNQALLKNRGR